MNFYDFAIRNEPFANYTTYIYKRFQGKMPTDIDVQIYSEAVPDF